MFLLKIEKQYIDDEWKLHSFRLELPQRLILSMERQCQWKINRMQERRNIPDYLRFLYLDGISSVKPENITVIR